MLAEPMLGLSTGAAGRRGDHARADRARRAATRTWSRSTRRSRIGASRSTSVRSREMNGYWNAYSAFNQNGSPRDAAHSTAAFRKAFARVYLILHGGRRRERAAGAARPAAGSGHAARRTRTSRVVWNPQGYGDPDLPGNSAQAYYPGDRYVDVVGDDLYDIRGKAAWAAAEALYKAHPGKPFAFPEWGLWGLDDPALRRADGAFVRSHPRTSRRATTRAGPARSSTSPRSRARAPRTGG